MPSYINAQQLDEVVVRWLLEASKSGELKRGLKEALRDTLSLRKKIEAERLLAEKQLTKLQQQQERLKGTVH